MSEKFLSMTDQAHLIPNRIGPLDVLGGIFGGLMFNPLPWQRAAMQNLAPLSPLRSGFDPDALRGMLNARAPRRPTPPWAYWQFKNGKIAPLSGPRDLPFEMDWDLAWDRSLGTYVCYAGR